MVSRHSIRTLAGVLLAGGALAGSLLGASGAQAATTTGYQAAGSGYQAARAQSGYWGYPVEGVVVSPGSLNVRSGPGVDYWINGAIDNGARVWISCKAEGTDIGGNDHWYRLADNSGWVTAYYVYHDDYVPWCDA